MNLHSKFRHLVVSGCSFTHNNYDTPCSWANTLAVWSGMTIDNLAIPGAGNTHIKNSTILHLEKTQSSPDDTLILIMWSGPERIDWITDRQQSNFKSMYPFEYFYTPENELTLGGSWWSNDAKTHLTQTIVEYSKYQSNSSLALNSWLQIQDLENYLKLHNYNYYFMSWFNYSDPVDFKNRWIEFAAELTNLGLTLDKTRWINSDVENSLGRWAQNHPEFLIADKFHMGWQGHEQWLRKILVPELINKNILSNEYSTR